MDGDNITGTGRSRDDGGVPTSTEEVRKYCDPSGTPRSYVRCVAVVPLSDFDYGARFKEMCGECPHHGKNFSCPPHSPSFVDYIGLGKRAQVVCIRLPKDDFPGLTPREIYHACFREGSRLLREELERHRNEGKVVAGSGPCLVCERCSLEMGESTCSRPEKRIYSLESLGVDVIGLLKKAFDIDLEWDSEEEKAPTVCSVGAVFFG